jgi:hypothetical protein
MKLIHTVSLAIITVLALPFIVLFAIFMGILSGAMNPINTRSRD